MDCPEGANFSRHKLLHADITAFDVKSKELKKIEGIVRMHHKILGISRMEDPLVTMHRGWLHLEFSSQTYKKDLVIFKV